MSFCRRFHLTSGMVDPTAPRLCDGCLELARRPDPRHVTCADACHRWGGSRDRGWSTSRDAHHRKVPLSRHRKIKCSRSKAVALIAAGAFVVAGTATAAAATWSPGPSGPAAGRAHEADAGSLLTVSGHTLQMQALEQSTTSEQSTASPALQAYQIRDVAAELSATHWKAARERAAQQ